MQRSRRAIIGRLPAPVGASAAYVPEAVYSGCADGYICHMQPGYTEHISNLRTAVIPLPKWSCSR